MARTDHALGTWVPNRTLALIDELLEEVERTASLLEASGLLEARQSPKLTLVKEQEADDG